LVLLWQVLEWRLEVDAEMVRQGGQQGPVVRVAPVPAADRAAGQRQLLPVAFLAARIAGRPAGMLSSVAGRVRWRWLGICALAALGFLAFSFGASLLVNQATGIALGPARGGWVGWDEFLPLAIVVVAVIPFQAAAEEYGFRGVLLQAVGAWVSPPVVAIAISSVVFGFVHGLPPPGFVAIASFGVVAAWLAIRTGGLEAALAVHVLNNVTHFLLDAATGRGNVWVSQLNAHITWPVAAIDVVSNVLYGVLIVLLYRRFMEE
jgi:membrane protease YdiL (CAAX protease family)